MCSGSLSDWRIKWMIVLVFVVIPLLLMLFVETAVDDEAWGAHSALKHRKT